MGGHGYDQVSRSARTVMYKSQSVQDTFIQQKERRAHESMLSEGARLREARDSDVHPNSVPIIIALDVTGSMGRIPAYIIKDGLPTLVSCLTERGLADPAILFLAVGDHLRDHAPLQVGQFESGDEQLDMWLTRTWLEGNGGGNGGESYMLPWYFAATRTVTDAWEKRKQKGFLFTIGDEPCHLNLEARAIREIFGENEASDFSSKELYKMASEKWHVYHINMRDGSYGSAPERGWKELIDAENVVGVHHVGDLIDKISEIILANSKLFMNPTSHERSKIEIEEKSEVTPQKPKITL